MLLLDHFFRESLVMLGGTAFKPSEIPGKAIAGPQYTGHLSPPFKMEDLATKLAQEPSDLVKGTPKTEA
jgi:hypothetical protein